VSVAVNQPGAAAGLKIRSPLNISMAAACPIIEIGFADLMGMPTQANAMGSVNLTLSGVPGAGTFHDATDSNCIVTGATSKSLSFTSTTVSNFVRFKAITQGAVIINATSNNSLNGTLEINIFP